MRRRVRRVAVLVTLVAALMAGAAPAALGANGNSGDAKCKQAASNPGQPNYNPATATGMGEPPAHAWDNDQNAWTRYNVTANP